MGRGRLALVRFHSFLVLGVFLVLFVRFCSCLWRRLVGFRLFFFLPWVGRALLPVLPVRVPVVLRRLVAALFPFPSSPSFGRVLVWRRCSFRPGLLLVPFLLPLWLPWLFLRRRLFVRFPSPACRLSAVLPLGGVRFFCVPAAAVPSGLASVGFVRPAVVSRRSGAVLFFWVGCRLVSGVGWRPAVSGGA